MQGAESQTVAIQTGPVTARASAYGEVFAYRPEDRAAMAIDGDATTAWRVADRFDATGQFIELTARATHRLDRRPATDRRFDGRRTEPVDHGDRRERRWWRVRSASTSTRRHDRPSGQSLPLPTSGTTVRLTIAATAAAPGSGDGLVATGLDAVGFAEIRTGLGPTVEVTRPPIDWLAQVTSGELVDTPIDQVLTRLRVDPANRWRRDPEPQDRARRHGAGRVRRDDRGDAAARGAGRRRGHRRAARALGCDGVGTADRDADSRRMGGDRR